VQPVLDQAAGDRVEARCGEDVGGRNKSDHGDVKLCGRLESIPPRATEIPQTAPRFSGKRRARASGRVRGIPGDSGRITPERAAKRGGEGGIRHGRPRSLRGSARLWQETSKGCKQR
jgi:hypothetical protein